MTEIHIFYILPWIHAQYIGRALHGRWRWAQKKIQFFFCTTLLLMWIDEVSQYSQIQHLEIAIILRKYQMSFFRQPIIVTAQCLQGIWRDHGHCLKQIRLLRNGNQINAHCEVRGYASKSAHPGCASKSAHSHVTQWLIDWFSKCCLYFFSIFFRKPS